jgi:hypothetical protein
MPILHSEVVIEAPAELIWGIIVDVARYPEWNPFNVRATSTLEIGAPIRMRVFGSSMQVGFDGVAQALKVRAEQMHRAAR